MARCPFQRLRINKTEPFHKVLVLNLNSSLPFSHRPLSVSKLLVAVLTQATIYRLRAELDARPKTGASHRGANLGADPADLRRLREENMDLKAEIRRLESGAVGGGGGGSEQAQVCHIW
jgi:hypothetical protein